MTRLPAFTAMTGAMLLSLSVTAFAGGHSDGQTSGSRSVGAMAQTSCGKDFKKVEIAQNSTSQSTSSTAFSDVSGSTVSFNTGGSSNSCVLVNFSAQAFAPADRGQILHLQAIRDGNITSVDGSIQLAAENASFSDAHAYNFLFTDVPPGAHTIKMQYRSQVSGQDVFINDFDMLVEHK